MRFIIFFFATILLLGISPTVKSQWFRGDEIIKVPVDSIKVLTKVDDVPFVPGGYATLSKYIQSCLKYPSICVLQNITGTVEISFQVDKRGLTNNVRVTKSANPILDRQCRILIERLPQFGIATYKGLAIEVDMSLQVVYDLKGKWKNVDSLDLTSQYHTLQYFDSANVELKASNFEEAIRLYTHSIVNDSTNHWSYYERGIAKYSLHEFSSAEKDFGEALRLTDGTMRNAYMTRGYLRMETGAIDSAIVDFLKVLEWYNESYSVHLALGKCWMEKKDFKLSRKYLRLANVYGPEFEEGFYFLGIVEMIRKEYEAAYEAFDKAIKLFPEYTDAYFNRGMASARMRKMEDACRDWIKASSFDHKQAHQLVLSQCRKFEPK